MRMIKAAYALEMAMGVEKNGEVTHYALFKKLPQAVQSAPLMSADEWLEYQGYLQATVQSAPKPRDLTIADGLHL